MCVCVSGEGECAVKFAQTDLKIMELENARSTSPGVVKRLTTAIKPVSSVQSRMVKIQRESTNSIPKYIRVRLNGSDNLIKRTLSVYDNTPNGRIVPRVYKLNRTNSDETRGRHVREPSVNAEFVPYRTIW